MTTQTDPTDKHDPGPVPTDPPGPYVGANTPEAVTLAGELAAQNTIRHAQLVNNPRTIPQALTWAYHQTQHRLHVPQNECDHVYALAYGYAHSGEESARAHWESLPANLQHGAGTHDPHRTAYAGAGLFWERPGGGGFGHVAMRAGHPGYCYGPNPTDDHPGDGLEPYALIPIAKIHAVWGLVPVGWSPPLFLHGQR